MRSKAKKAWALTGLMAVVVLASASSCKEPGDYSYSLSLTGGTTWAADTTWAIPFTVNGGGVKDMTTCALDFLVSQGGKSTAVQQLGGGSLGGGSQVRSASVTLNGGSLPPGSYTVRSICSFAKSGNLPKGAENTVGVTLLEPTASPSPSPSGSASASASASASPSPTSTPQASTGGGSAPSAPSGPSSPSPSTSDSSTPSAPSAPSGPSSPSAPSSPMPPG